MCLLDIPFIHTYFVTPLYPFKYPTQEEGQAEGECCVVVLSLYNSLKIIYTFFLHLLCPACLVVHVHEYVLSMVESNPWDKIQL